MKTLGLIGGTGPESTVDYYRLLIAEYRKQADGSSPPLIINSIDMKRMIPWMNAREFGRVADYLVDEFGKLEKAGVDFAALTANTAHIVFEEIQERISLPLVSIVEATCERAQELGVKKVGLFGTRFTMEESFYPKVFSRTTVNLVMPNDRERVFIHEIYFSELLNDVFSPETKSKLLAIADEMKARDGIEALILGGTELPLLLRAEEHNGITFLDTTRIHVDRLVKEMLG